MAKTKLFASGSSLAAALTVSMIGGIGLAAPAAAQDAEEDIVVTGSYIRGTPEDAALPVDVISAESLQQQGSPTVVQLVKTLTSTSGGSIGESNRFLGSTAGAASVNLRGFGASRTLVLMNGQRLAINGAGVALGEVVDINLIPTAAIGRIEILRDGAAATYGSDAVGGVVNFITRRDLEGFEIDGSYSAISGSEGDYDINGAWGWQNDRGNILLTAGYRRRSELQTRDLDYALLPQAANPFGGWSAAGNPGVFATGTAPQLATGSFTSQFQDVGCTLLGGNPGAVSAATPAGSCGYPFTNHDNIVNDEYHYQLFGEVNYELADNLDFHVEAMWTRHDVPEERVSAAQSTTQWPAPIAASGGSAGGGTSPYPATGLNQQSRFYVPGTNPGLVALMTACPASIGGANCANALANGAIASQTLWRPAALGGTPLNQPDGADTQRRMAQAFRVSGGLSGEFGDSGIGWTTNVTYMQLEGVQETPDLAVNRIQLALRGLGGPGCNPVTGTPGVGNCLWFNPFSNAIQQSSINGATNPNYNPALANSPVLWNWMHIYQVAEITSTLFTAEGVLNGELPIDFGGGNVAWAFGGQWRYDEIERNYNAPGNSDITPCVDSPPYGDGLPVCSGGTGAFTFYAGQQNESRDRNVSSLFGEVQVPITDSFEISGAVRYEDYGGNIGGTTNPRVSARWQVMPWIAVRGSAGSTFRAPSQAAISPGFARQLGQFTDPTTSLSLYRPVDVYGNPNLVPETADTYNVGFIVEAGGFRATVDYFNFKFQDEITTETQASVYSTMFPGAAAAGWQCNNATLASRFTFASGPSAQVNPVTGTNCHPGNFLGIAINVINGPPVDTSGVDLTMSYDWDDVLGGAFTIGADATYLIEYQRGAVRTLDGITIAAPTDRAGTSELVTAFYSYPEWRGNLWFNYNHGPANLRWTVHYIEGTQDRNHDIDPGAGVVWPKRGDYVQHDVTARFELPWDLDLTASVLNVFNDAPPFTRSQYNYDYTNANPLPRVFEVGFRKAF